jgi:beta-glucosidase/6-phospho-beta-glucosidase/beta-galactosidase
MTEQEIEKLVQEKLDEAYKAEEHPKKFFITENGRGVTDGGDLYNALLSDMMRISQKALTEILKEALKK